MVLIAERRVYERRQVIDEIEQVAGMQAAESMKADGENAEGQGATKGEMQFHLLTVCKTGS